MTETVILRSNYTEFNEIAELEKVTAQRAFFMPGKHSGPSFVDRSCLMVRNANQELYDELRELERKHDRAVDIARRSLEDQFKVEYTALIEKHGASLEPRQER